MTEATQKSEGMRAQLAMVQVQCDFWKRKHFEVERELQNLKREHGGEEEAEEAKKAKQT